MKSGIKGTIHLNGDSTTKDRPNFILLGTKGVLYLTDPNGFGGNLRFLPNITDFNAPDAFEELPPGNLYCENERGLGASEMAGAVPSGDPCFRTSKELGLHVLKALQGMLKSGEDRTFQVMTTACSIPPRVLRLTA